MKLWHVAAFAQFQSDVNRFQDTTYLATNNVQYSYSILRADGQALDPTDLKDTLLLQLNNEVKDRVRTGWSMLYPFTRSELAPKFSVDEASGNGQDDFIECALLRASDRLESTVDMWRITPTGKVTLIRPYWEDEGDWNKQIGQKPGTWFSPNLQVRAAAEFVRHAQAFSEKFDTPVLVDFLLEWRGLGNRTIYDPFGYYSFGGSATADNRKVTKQVPISALANSWPEIVSDLVAPVVRLFNGSFKVTPDWVRNQAPTWLRS